MTLEDMKYYSILLGVGETEDFNKYINDIISTDSELDDLSAELLYESNNISKCVDILTNHYRGKIVDDKIVACKLITFIKTNLLYNRLNKIEAIEMLVKFSKEANKLSEDTIKEPWATMKLLGFLLDKDNTIILDSYFDNFINHGKTLTGDSEFEDIFNRIINK